MEHFLKVDGVIAAQTPGIQQEFAAILPDFDIVIEIGFDRGALTSWLHQNKSAHTRLISYDISFGNKQIFNDAIDFRQGDCFDSKIIEEIKNLIQSTGRVLVLCDGGNKEREFELYSEFLKKDDVIMLHDYAHSEEEYQQICSRIGWRTSAESRYSNIQTPIHNNNLLPYKYDAFKEVLWGAFIKG